MTALVGCAPQVHIRVCDVRSPSEIDCVVIVERQTAILRTRKDPIHIAITRRYEVGPNEEGKREDGAAVSIPDCTGK